MTRQRIMGTLVVVAAIFASVATVAIAATFADGDYTLTLPGAGVFEFTVDSEGGETVVAVAAPEGYAVDDNHPDLAGWKNAAGLEIEAKPNKVEADVNWEAGDVFLALPDGGSIIIKTPDPDGAFVVTTTGNWWAFGSSRDWYVANNADIALADIFFKVEAENDRFEVKPVDVVDRGFLNDLQDEEQGNAEEEEPEQEEEAKEQGEGQGEGRGRP